MFDTSREPRCDPPPDLQPPGHDLNALAAPVAVLVVFDGIVVGAAPRDAGFDAFGVK